MQEQNAAVPAITRPEHQQIEPTVEQMAVSFRRDLEWRHKSPATIRTYADAIRSLDEFLVQTGMSRQISSLTREHLEAFVADQLERHSAATAKLRFAACKAMFTWLVEEGELVRSPMERMVPPVVMVEPVRVVDTEDLRRLLAACGDGRDEFSNRRDTAIVRLLIARGPRVGELVGMKTEDVDLDHRLFTVVGKGSKPRVVSLSHSAMAAIDRYLRARARNPQSWRPELWLSGGGVMSVSGVQKMLKRRSEQACIAPVRPHMLRHTAAARSRAKGVPDSTMRLTFGWAKGSSMVERYGAAHDVEIARRVYEALEPDADL